MTLTKRITSTANHEPNSLTHRTLWVMAITSGAAAANLYYNQPLLAMMARTFHATDHAVGLVPMFTLLGYAIGILLIVPLGDIVERRRLIVTMIRLTAIALAATAVSPNLTWLLIASFAIGCCTIAAQLVIPFATQLANSPERGKVVGMIMSGLLAGILLSRTISGMIGARFGWQVVYGLASVLMVLLSMLLAKVLPQSRASKRTSYPDLMRSLFPLIQQQPILREASLISALSFGAFNVFWSTLVFLLSDAPYHYSSAITGLFGLIGVVGTLAAPLVGRFADRRSPRLTAILGLIISTFSFLLFWRFGEQLLGLIAGVVLLDLGVQATLVSNQARIYSLPQSLHSRLNALFITFYIVGGAVGSYLGAYGWSRGWHGVCVAGIVLLMLALISAFKFKRKQPQF